jgi:diaminopimelate decarboxylase
MDLQPFEYRSKSVKSKSTLYCEKVSLLELARRHGTPLYVYSASQILARFQMFDQAFAGMPHTICYSVKANSNLSILRMLAHAGAGFDIVSGGELERVRSASGNATRKVVFSGVGKSVEELDRALKSRILIFNVESEGELQLLSDRAAKLGRRAQVALRVNPDVFAKTHPYMSTGLKEHKFGVDIRLALGLYRAASKLKCLDPIGISVHIGSQITDVEPFRAAVERVASLARQLKRHGIPIRYIDAGGGLGISYHRNRAFVPLNQVSQYAAALRSALKGMDVHLLLEPGRFLVGNSGVLVTQVLYIKRNHAKTFVIVDAAMNDLLRPALVAAHHEILPVNQIRTGDKFKKVDVVGPICDSGDFLARDRRLSEVHPGDLLAILDVGAYGMSYASNYNSRKRPAELLVQGNQARVIRKREQLIDLIRLEL